jgi:hypothetical protein
MKETVCFSETLVSSYESTRRQNPEQQHRHPHRHENLKSHNILLSFKELLLIITVPRTKEILVVYNSPVVLVPIDLFIGRVFPR